MEVSIYFERNATFPFTKGFEIMAVSPIIRPAVSDELEEIWEWIESFDAVVENGKPGLASGFSRKFAIARSRAACKFLSPRTPRM